MVERRLTTAQFNDVRLIDGPVVSPDRNLIAWVEVALDEVSERANHRIWIKSVDGGRPKCITEGTKAFSPRFSPDSGRIVYLANYGDGTAIFVCSVRGDGDRVQLTPKGAAPSDPRWSPDGRSIAYTRSVSIVAPPATRAAANAPVVIRDVYFHADGTGLVGASRRHLFVTDVEGRRHRQITEGDWHDQDFCWTPNSRSLVFVSNRSEDRWNQFRRSALWLVNVSSRQCRRLTPEAGDVAHPQCLNDDEVVYVGQLSGGFSSAHRQMLCARISGKVSVSVLLDSHDITPSHISLRGDALLVGDQGKSVYFLAPWHGRVPLFKLMVASGKVTRILDGDFQITGFSLAGKLLAYVRQWSSGLPEVYSKMLSARGLGGPVSRLNQSLVEGYRMGQTSAIRYQSDDGLDLEMFVVLPPDYRPGKRYPLWLTIHGGPHGMHPVLDNPLMYQIQAALGYVVMLPNPRGSVSYGQTFMKGCVRDWGGGDYRDIMKGVDVLIDQGYVRSDRLYVEGYSYGGIMAAWIVGHTERFRAAVIGAPVTDQFSDFGTSDEPHFCLESLGGTPQQVPDEYRKRSAITYVDNVTTPVQLQHYEGDLRCPIGQSMQFYMALKFLGREVEFVRYPGGSHVGRTPSQWRDMQVRMHDWFASHR